MHAGGSGVKLDDGPALKLVGPESFSLYPYLEIHLVLNLNLECGLPRKIPMCGLRLLLGQPGFSVVVKLLAL